MQCRDIIFFVLIMQLLTTGSGLLDGSGWEENQSKKCNLPQQVGWCRASFRRYYYNGTTATCQAFTYGGCGGNENRFMDLPTCVQKCERFESLPRKCKLLPDVGDGRAYLERYYYDFRYKICTTFVYGGIGGNENNFLTIEHCIQECADFGIMPAKCKLRQIRGSCKASFVRFSYNPQMRKCQRFIYTGCGANANNFLTIQDCIRKCEGFV